MRRQHRGGGRYIDKERINPGYSAIGRLKGLAELRGVAAALSRRGA